MDAPSRESQPSGSPSPDATVSGAIPPDTNPPDEASSGVTPSDASSSDRTAPKATFCGYVALVGAPNAGKSTLLNALVGEPLSIVTAKAQTTWRRITGIRSTAAHQMIFLDTPGVLEPRDMLHRSLLVTARTAVREADVSVLVLDPLAPLDATERTALLEVAGLSRAPAIGVVNKVDSADEEAVRAEERWLQATIGRRAAGGSPLRISALAGEGLDGLLSEIERLLPAGPFLYPVDEIASDPVRLFAAEFVREAIFEDFRNEIPYATYCEVEAFRDDPDRTYVQVVLYVERASQKGILIGKGGKAIRSLGTKARGRLERLLDRPVYLDLWIKVLPGWRKKKHHLRRLGFAVPDDDAEPKGS